MENKQTAVEWLEELLHFECKYSLNNEVIINYDVLDNIIMKAKQMGKEQMFKFAEQVLKNTECSFTGLPFMTTGYDNIYEETYGK